MDDKIKKTSETILSKVSQKKKNENEEDTKKRMKEILSKREAAIKTIEEYQDSTEIPTDEEVDSHFLEENNIDEFEEK